MPSSTPSFVLFCNRISEKRENNQENKTIDATCRCLDASAVSSNTGKPLFFFYSLCVDTNIPQFSFLEVTISQKLFSQSHTAL